MKCATTHVNGTIVCEDQPSVDKEHIVANGSKRRIKAPRASTKLSLIRVLIVAGTGSGSAVSDFHRLLNAEVFVMFTGRRSQMIHSISARSELVRYAAANSFRAASAGAIAAGEVGGFSE